MYSGFGSRTRLTFICCSKHFSHGSLSFPSRVSRLIKKFEVIFETDEKHSCRDRKSSQDLFKLRYRDDGVDIGEQDLLPLSLSIKKILKSLKAPEFFS